MVTYVVTFLWTWYYVLLPFGTFEVAVTGEGSRILINAISSLIVLIFAETFRRAMRRAMAERNREIAGRNLLLEELEHRTKNDFALSVSLLETQKRRHSNPEVVETLSQAIERIRAFSRAYAHVSETRRQDGAVEMQPYLEEAVGRMAHAAFSDRIAVSVHADAMTLPRDTAVAIGLFANEALTNCAKYAFPADRAGTVQVDFSKRPGGWELAIRDDGVGVQKSTPGEGSTGIGARLLAAFAKQAGATFISDDISEGCHIRLISQGSQGPGMPRI